MGRLRIQKVKKVLPPTFHRTVKKRFSLIRKKTISKYDFST